MAARGPVGAARTRRAVPGRPLCRVAASAVAEMRGLGADRNALMAKVHSQRFGDLLRLRRLAARLTQVQLADRAGLSRRGIQDLERGINLPRTDTLELLIGALQLTDPERSEFVAATLRGSGAHRRSSPEPAALGEPPHATDLAAGHDISQPSAERVPLDEIGYRQDLYHERRNRDLSLQEVVSALNLLAAPTGRTSLLTQREYERIEGGGRPSPFWELTIRRFLGNTGPNLFEHVTAQRARSGRFEEIDSLRRYLDRLVDLYGKLKLPIGPAQGFSLAAVFQPLRLHRPSETRGFYAFRGDPAVDESELDSAALDTSSDLSDEAVAEDGFQAIEKSVDLSGNRYGRIVVLGGPGSGKSTLLKHFVAHQARVVLDYVNGSRLGLIGRDRESLIPMFVSLPELQRSGRTLKEYISTMLQDMFVDERLADHLWEHIEHGRAFVCLDGLDEVMMERMDLIRTLNALMRGSHEGTVWVVSSRFTEYKRGQFDLGHLTEWELLPLDHARRHKLCHRLIPEVEGLIHGSQRSDPGTFLQAVERHTRIFGWGRNPLLLSLAAILYVRRGTLPDSRRELYRQVLDAIVELREPSLDIVAREMLVAMTGFISYRLFVQGTGRHFSATDLVRLLRAFQVEMAADWRYIERLGRSLINTGIIEAVGTNTFAFLHQTFQEYLAAHHIANVSRDRASEAIRYLLDNIRQPFSRLLIIELAHIVHQHDSDLETELYDSVIGRLLREKEQILDLVSREERAELSATGGALDTCLMALADVWTSRYCNSLDAGSAAIKRDVELASSIAAVMERAPRSSAVPTLIRGLHKYPRRARFLGALGRIATPEAGQAILAFARAQLATLEDPGVLIYVVGALGDAGLVEAVPILEAVRDNAALDLDIRIEAHHVLASMGEPSAFDEALVYSLPRIQRGLQIEDDQGRPADWKRLRRYCEWLPAHMSHETLRPHYDDLLSALEGALGHPYEVARIPIVIALGRVGRSATFSKLLRMLERGEASGDLAEETLIALRRLVERRRFVLSDHELDRAIASIQRHYPFLHDELEMFRQVIQEAVRDPLA
jgi:transcriptional regulator with XRE-family HTH domain